MTHENTAQWPFNLTGVTKVSQKYQWLKDTLVNISHLQRRTNKTATPPHMQIFCQLTTQVNSPYKKEPLKPSVWISFWSFEPLI